MVGAQAAHMGGVVYGLIGAKRTRVLCSRAEAISGFSALRGMKLTRQRIPCVCTGPGAVASAAAASHVRCIQGGGPVGERADSHMNFNTVSAFFELKLTRPRIFDRHRSRGCRQRWCGNSRTGRCGTACTALSSAQWIPATGSGRVGMMPRGQSREVVLAPLVPWEKEKGREARVGKRCRLQRKQLEGKGRKGKLCITRTRRCGPRC